MEPKQRPVFPVPPSSVFSVRAEVRGRQISCEVGGAQSSQTLLLLSGWCTILQGGSCSVWWEPPSYLFSTTRAFG